MKKKKHILVVVLLAVVSLCLTGCATITEKYSPPADVQPSKPVTEPTTATTNAVDLSEVAQAQQAFLAQLATADPSSTFMMTDFTKDGIPEMIVQTGNTGTIYSWRRGKLSALSNKMNLGEIYKIDRSTLYIAFSTQQDAGITSSIMRYFYDTGTYSSPVVVKTVMVKGFEDQNPADGDNSKYTDAADKALTKEEFTARWNQLLEGAIPLTRSAQQDTCVLQQMTTDPENADTADTAVYQLICCANCGTIIKHGYTKEEYLSMIPTLGSNFENTNPPICPVCQAEGTLHTHAVIK